MPIVWIFINILLMGCVPEFGPVQGSINDIFFASAPPADRAAFCNPTITTPPFVSGNLNVPTGTSASDPYPVCSKAQLDAIAADTTLWGDHYILTTNIDMDNSGANNSIIGSAATNFTGTFNGAGFTISNFKHVDAASSNIGFFGVAANPAVISNLNFSSITVSGQSTVGALAGAISTGVTINSVAVQGNVFGSTSSIGGLIGSVTTATLTNTAASVAVSAASANIVGGLIGIATSTSIQDSNGTGTITAGSVTGGLVGFFSGGEVGNSTSTYSVIGNGTTAGLIGQADSSTITHSAFIGDVTSSGISTGGLIGTANTSTITHSDAAGSVTSSAITQGGLIGALNGGTIQTATSSAYLVNTSLSATADVGGLVGEASPGHIQFSTSSSSISVNGAIVGGVVGDMKTSSTLTGCGHIGDITASGTVGGIVGNLTSTEVKDCYHTNGFVLGNSTEGEVGGGFGAITSSSISFTYVIASVANISTASGTGGFSGVANGFLIHDSWTDGEVTGPNEVAGFIGNAGNNGGKLFNIQSNMTVSTTVLGGAAGITADGTNNNMTHVVNLGNMSAFQYAGGISRNILVASSSHSFGSIKATIGFSGGAFSVLDSVGYVSQTYSAGNVWGTSASLVQGGFVSGVLNASITHSAAYGHVINGPILPGGFIGSLFGDKSVIFNSFAIGTVSSPSNATRSAGFVGTIQGGATIQDSFAQGAVTGGSNFTAGLVGGQNNAGGTVANSYSTASIATSAANAGGSIGDNTAGTLSNIYWDGDFGGDTLLDDGNPGANLGTVTSLPTTFAVNQASYAGFDFTNTWVMPLGADGNGYPKLRSHYFCHGAALTDAPFANSSANPAGTKEDPFQICTAVQFAAIAFNSGQWNKYFVLGEDLDMSGGTLNPIGTSVVPFSGTFDGRGHTLSHFSMGGAGTDDVGVFGYVQASSGSDLADFVEDGTIQHLTVHNAAFTGATGVGAIVGNLQSGKILLVKVTGTTTIDGVDSVGGVVGSANNFYMTTNSAGALTERGALIQRAGVTSSVTITGTGDSAGGIVGTNTGKVEYAHFRGVLNGAANNGGVAGTNAGEVSNSLSEFGNITVSGNTGGLVGNNTGTITFSFSGGAIPGLVGANTGTVRASFYDDSVDTNASAAGVGQTTANMILDTTFTNAGWSLANWIFRGSYPDLLSDGEVDL